MNDNPSQSVCNFLAVQDARVVGDKIVRAQPVYVDLVEPPLCGFWTATWLAVHPERGTESGMMLVSRDPYADEPYARNIVCEVLWGRGYQGAYNVVLS